MTIDIHNAISGVPIKNGSSVVGKPISKNDDRAFNKPTINELEDKYATSWKYPRYYTGNEN
jgi:hypothetical protein